MTETCRCPIVPGMNYDQLLHICAEGKQCCDTRVNPGRGWMCPTMMKELHRADADRDRRRRAAKKLKAIGYTEEEIRDMPTRSRRRTGTVQDTVPELNFDE